MDNVGNSSKTRTNLDGCAICQVPFPTVESMQIHYIGKKHQIAAHQFVKRENIKLRSVFSMGWPNKLDKSKIIEFLNSFGPVETLHVAKNNRFVIITFKESKTAQELIQKKVAKLLNKQITFKAKENNESQGLNQQTGLYEILIQSLKQHKTFERELDFLKYFILARPEALNQYITLCRDLELCLRPKYNRCEAHPFGSTLMGLAFKDSDVDVHIRIPEEYKYPDNPESPYYVRALNVAAEALKSGNRFAQVECIKNAKTPIVKCVHKLTNIKCDINFKTMLGVWNSHLLRFYISSLPKLRDCIVILKLWCKVRLTKNGLNRLSNYALIFMFIFYLQQAPFNFPSVMSLQMGAYNFQDGWNAGFNPAVCFSIEHAAKTSIRNILLGFFEYSNCFNYDDLLFCPYFGHSLPKAVFQTENIRDIPEEFQYYIKNYLANPEEFERLVTDTPMCVQDPFEHNRNITRAINVKFYEEFRVEVCKAVEVFKSSNCSTLFRLFSNYVEKQHINFVLKIPKQSQLVFLFNSLPKTSSAPDLQLKIAWFQFTKQFLMDVLEQIYKFSLEVKEELESADKKPKLADTDGKTVELIAKGCNNLWEARNFIEDGFTFNAKSKNSFLKHVEISDYILSKLQPVAPTLQIINFNLTMQYSDARINFKFNSNLNSYSDFFGSFAEYFCKSFPQWYAVYRNELNLDEIQKNNVNNEKSLAVASSGSKTL